MAGAANPAAAGAVGAAAPAAGATPSGGQGLKGGGQAAVAPGPNFTAARAPQMSGSTQPNVFQQAAGAYGSALSGARAAGSFSPRTVGASNVGTQFGYNPNNVMAQTAVGGIGTYMNPYTQEVIDRTQADIARQSAMAQNQLGAQATQAGAFGGSRHGVAEGTMLGDYGRAFGDIAAQQRQQGFNTALGASQQDVANQMQASLANQAAAARAAEFGQSSRLQAQLANQQSRLQAAMANQRAGLEGAQLGLSAANQMSGLAGQGFGFGQQIGQQQMQQGMMQQMLNQQLIDAARGQYAGFTGAPQQSLGLPMAAVGAGNMGQRTETTSRKPGLFDFLSLGAMLNPFGGG